MSATARTIQATPSVGRWLALGALVVVTALIVVLSYAQLTSTRVETTVPAAAPAPMMVDDRGWTSTTPLVLSAADDEPATDGSGLRRAR